MTTAAATDNPVWAPQSDAAAFIADSLAAYLQINDLARDLARRMLHETGTRFVDWIDHLALPDTDNPAARLTDTGFRAADDDAATWRHPGGLFPVVRLIDGDVMRVSLKAERIADFIAAHRLPDIRIEGEPLGRLRTAVVAKQGDSELAVVERHGYRGFTPPRDAPQQRLAAASHFESFQLRRRDFADDADGFARALELIDLAIADLGRDWACDLFFAAERDYWQRRNRAARTQKARQDALGLGWANHDHHTYRCSRAYFTHLIGVLEKLGFNCRERFYAGREAGWGAQVLEQPVCGVVIFADVDLDPQEVTGDFAHEPLPPRDSLGTVGLWCRLHGEAFLQAGMHHLECQFDFTAARRQLAESGVSSMKPFTDMPILKQSFTEGEVWPVSESRIRSLLDDGLITDEQAARFRREGALGSHLEILERHEGYKGFNQSGINEIILETDPRRQKQPVA